MRDSPLRNPIVGALVVVALGLPVMLAARAASEKAAPPTRHGPVEVTFVLTAGANVVDFTGPWEVFQDVYLPEMGEVAAFHLYTISDAKEPLTLTGGLRVLPDHTFAESPKADIVVVGAQRGSDAMLAWLKTARGHAEVVMSVCTGAFKLAKAGLLDGKEATPHHDFFEKFAHDFPQVRLVRGRRWVESAKGLYTAGGLTSGIDLALHVVASYYGDGAAERAAAYMEHGGGGWKDATATTVASRGSR